MKSSPYFWFTLAIGILFFGPWIDYLVGSITNYWWGLSAWILWIFSTAGFITAGIIIILEKRGIL